MTLHAADAADVALERGTDSERGLPGEEAGGAAQPLQDEQAAER